MAISAINATKATLTIVIINMISDLVRLDFLFIVS